MYGTHLSSNNGSLRTVLSELKQALVASLGNRCNCAGMINDIEQTIKVIENKLFELATEERLSLTTHPQLSFAVEPIGVEVAYSETSAPAIIP